MTLGQLIKQRRKDMKMSQINAAIGLHISQSTLSRIENDTLDPDDQLKEDIINFFHIEEVPASVVETPSEAETSCNDQNIENRTIDNTPIEKKNFFLFLMSEASYLYFFLLIILSFILAGFGVPFACYAVFFAIRKHYKKWVIALTILLALFELLCLINTYFLIFPVKTQYTRIY